MNNDSFIAFSEFFFHAIILTVHVICMACFCIGLGYYGNSFRKSLSCSRRMFCWSLMVMIFGTAASKNGNNSSITWKI